MIISPSHFCVASWLTVLANFMLKERTSRNPGVKDPCSRVQNGNALITG